MLGAVASLPRTLVHGDPHRGNILLAAGTATLIDWGGARVAPAALDLAVLRAQGAVDLTPYRVRFAELTGGGPPPELLAVEGHWADVYAHVQYLGFAADHLGPERVRDMVAVAARAHVALDAALRR
jgi:thiamine kinase-like enzyme